MRELTLKYENHEYSFNDKEYVIVDETNSPYITIYHKEYKTGRVPKNYWIFNKELAILRLYVEVND